MTPPKTSADFLTRFNRAKQRYVTRDKLIRLCREMYFMDKTRNSGYLDVAATHWRTEMPAEYFESSNKPQDVVDVMTAVLSGHTPQYHCTIPGNVGSPVPSRAEQFLKGVWRVNSRRQVKDLSASAVHKTVRDSGAAIRVYWMPDPPRIEPQVINNIDNPEAGEKMVVQHHTPDTFPICIEIVNLDNIYTLGRAAFGRPFTELFYVQQRSVDSVLDEWGDLVKEEEITKGLAEEDYYSTNYEYIEWWGRDRAGAVWYAIMYNGLFIIDPVVTEYPDIPFIITTYKEGDDDNPSRERLPFLYPIIHAIEKLEYVKARGYRQLDAFTTMNPFHSGEEPIEGVEGSWGKIMELGPKESIEWPRYPGQPPDIYKEVQGLEDAIAEGSFSSAMFGQVSVRASGYALSQVIGADTLRTDNPRSNLEYAFSRVADLIFGLLRVFSPGIHQAVVAEVKSQRMGTMLSGEETNALVTECFIKPKQTNDEVRLATIGAQLAGLPKPAVSNYYILEHYFGLDQPEEEIARLMDEEAARDPVIRMMVMAQILRDAGSPYASIIEGQLQQAIAKTQMQQAAPPGSQGMGLGLQQGVMGNEPIIPPSGNPSEEAGPTMESMMYGGPREEF